MPKLIKDMTQSEKQERISHLSHKFYDINTTPTTILYTEMQYGKQDDHILTLLKNLEKMEAQCLKIKEECSTKLNTQLHPWKKVFEYEFTELEKRQAREKIVPPSDRLHHDNRAETAKRHRQEIDSLKKTQKETIDNIRTATMSKYETATKQMYYAFMAAVQYLYR